MDRVLLERQLALLPLAQYEFFETDELEFSERIRTVCEVECPRYGKTWACPPAVGTLEACREKCLRYSSAFVFMFTYQLKNSFGFDGMMQGHRQFKAVCDRLYERLAQPFLLLSNEGCIRCKTCTYPAEPCRFPDRLFPSLEGYGILVTELAKSAGLPYRTGPNTVSYFGLVCYD